MNNYNKLIIFITILILGFVIAILYFSWPLLTGKSYVLRIMPVDPIDILRGQYMAIRYEINIIQIKAKDISEQDIGKTVYILLKEDENKTWRFKDYSFEKPVSGDFIKGKVKSISGNSIDVEYGIEQYFFERGAYVPRFNQVEVKIGNSGQARISKLLEDGEPIDIRYRE